MEVARKVTVDSKGRDCDWDSFRMDATVDTAQTVTHVESINERDAIPVRLSNGYWYSPDALDLVTAAE